ncbi:hypothetical protein [Sulfuricurvum sp.]|uniref:hypothetical protein n=1 Tax=Sulfuricurvum sp. TaxID=2025608 RepID=UPI00356178E7
MANFKGSTYEKQGRDAKIRCDARGTKRYGPNRYDGLAHSHATLQSQQCLFNDFAKYALSNGLDPKLNLAMTKKHFLDFLSKRTALLSASSCEVYISRWCAYIKALRSKNITIDSLLDYHFFQRCKDQFNGRPDKKSFKKGRYINPMKFEDILSKLPKRSQVVARLQYFYAFRAEEALLVANYLEKFLHDGELTEVPGKGGQRYMPKLIDEALINNIRSTSKISKGAYYRDLRKVMKKSSRAHDFRLSFAVNRYNELRNDGASHKNSMKITSEEMNHHRLSITAYYLARA